jgi:predicted nucleotidyltransferase
MATSKDEILRDIKRYIAELNNSGIPIYKAVLFGSWARGKASEESDVDVVLISDERNREIMLRVYPVEQTLGLRPCRVQLGKVMLPVSRLTPPVFSLGFEF